MTASSADYDEAANRASLNDQELKQSLRLFGLTPISREKTISHPLFLLRNRTPLSGFRFPLNRLLLGVLALAFTCNVYADAHCNDTALFSDDTLSLIFSCKYGKTVKWTDENGYKLVIECGALVGDGFTATLSNSYVGSVLYTEHVGPPAKGFCPFDSETLKTMFNIACPPPPLRAHSDGWVNDDNSAGLTIRCEPDGKIQVVWSGDGSSGRGKRGEEEFGLFDGHYCPVSAAEGLFDESLYSPNYPCGTPYQQTHKDGNTTKIEQFAADGCLAQTDMLIYDDRGQLKEELISDRYNCTGVAGRVTHKTPSGDERGVVTTEISIYDGWGHLVNVTTFDDHGVPKRSDARAPFAPTGQPGISDNNLHPGSGHGSGHGRSAATGGTAGVASTSPTPSHLHPGTKWHQDLTGSNTDASATQNTSAGSTNSSSGQTGTGSKNQIIWQKPSSAATNLGTSSTGGNSATGGTAGVANGLSAQSDAENKRKIIWQKSSSGGATSSVTTTTSSGSGSSRRKSQSRKSLNSPSQGAGSNANVQGSGRSGGSAHPTPTPTSRKKKPGIDVQNEH